MILLTNSFKRLVGNKSQSLYSLACIALSFALPIVICSLAISFCGQSFIELLNISGFLKAYTQNTSNALFKLCGAMTIACLILGSIGIVSCYLKLVQKRRLECKNYLLMGASFAQVLIAVWFENFVLFVAGLLVGVLFAWCIGWVIGLIYSIHIIVYVNIILIACIIYFTIMTIISIVGPLWVSTTAR